MIIDKKKEGTVMKYIVDKDPNVKMDKILNTHLKPSQIAVIINHDADVYTKDGHLLLKFRKKKLSTENTTAFYDNVIKFAQTKTTNRGSASGSKSKNNWDNPPIMTNIIGYFDKLSPRQKFVFNRNGKSLPKITTRETRFVRDNYENYLKIIPLITEIDRYYEKYIPDKYKLQKKKADQTPFKIKNTSFTTITTNVNFQTTVHTDKGDDMDGFGNLVVIEHGKYEGGETCFPQYGIGVDVRTGDILFMDVHQPHGNCAIIQKSSDAKRLSIVCYLRTNVYNQTKGKTRKFMETHNKTLKKNSKLN